MQVGKRREGWRWGGVMGRKGVWVAVLWGLILAAGVLALCQRWRGAAYAALDAAPSNVRTVCASGCDHPTVQDAVDAAENGDVIKVAEGLYTGVQVFSSDDLTVTALIYIENKRLTIRGGYAAGQWDVSDPDAHPTILDAQGQGRVLVIDNESEGGEVVIDGVHIVGGDAGASAGGFGGGGYFDKARVILRRSVVSGNVANHGGGVFVHRSTADVIGCQIVSNTAIEYGGGLVFFISDDTTVVSSTIAGNKAQTGGGVYLHRSSTTMINNFYVDNRGNNEAGGLFVTGTDTGGVKRPRLLHTTIARNAGGGVKIESNNEVEMINTIIASHTVGLDVVGMGVASLEATLWNGNDEDWQGDGNISRQDDYHGDPAFVDAAAGDYHIGPGSAARDRGVEVGVFVDFEGDGRPRGGGYDIGADEFPNPLALSLSATPAMARPGQPLTYVIHLSNFDSTVLTAAITSTLPAQVQPAGRVTTWTEELIDPGEETWEALIPVTVSRDCRGVFVHTVDVVVVDGDRFSRSLSLGCFNVHLPVVVRAYR